MARRKRTASRREPDALDALLESSGAHGAEDLEALAGELKKALAERMLNAEMDMHLAADCERAAGNHRNGTSPKGVLTAPVLRRREVSMAGLGEDSELLTEFLVPFFDYRVRWCLEKIGENKDKNSTYGAFRFGKRRIDAFEIHGSMIIANSAGPSFARIETRLIVFMRAIRPRIDTDGSASAALWISK